MYRFRLRLPSNRKHSADCTWTTTMFGFYDSRGEGAGQFPKDIPAQQNTAHTARVRGAIGKKSDMCFAVLIFDVEKVLAQAIAT